MHSTFGIDYTHTHTVLTILEVTYSLLIDVRKCLETVLKGGRVRHKAEEIKETCWSCTLAYHV